MFWIKQHKYLLFWYTWSYYIDSYIVGAFKNKFCVSCKLVSVVLFRCYFHRGHPKFNVIWKIKIFHISFEIEREINVGTLRSFSTRTTITTIDKTITTHNKFNAHHSFLYLYIIHPRFRCRYQNVEINFHMPNFT